MKTSCKIFFVMFLLSQVTFSQSSNFKNKLEELVSIIKDLETGKSTFKLAITSDEPGVAAFKVNEITKKGKSSETLYEFNFADIDVNTVRYETKGDVLQVQLIVKQNQRMIKVTQDAEKVSYDKELMMIAQDVENARAIVDKVKELIPISNKITENRLSLNSYNGRLNWLVKNVFSVEGSKEKYEQSLEISNSYPGDLVLNTMEISSKSSKEKEYRFNLSNINPYGIQFKNKGSDFVLSVETKRKLKAIKVIEDGDNDYTNTLEIVCQSVENARDLQKVLKDIIPLSEEKFTASLPKVTSLQEGINLLNQKVSTITTNKIKIEQKLEGACILNFHQVKESDKKKENHEYELNLIDVNSQDIEINVKGKEVVVEINTIAKNKFIKHLEDKELQNYTNKLAIIFNSFEEALVGEKVIKDLVKLCEAKKRVVSGSVDAFITQIEEVSLGKTKYEQKVETLSSSDVKYTSMKVSDKKSEESIYEFKLEDIDSKSVEMKVSGKEISVEFVTNYEEKIIKAYKNGEIKNYVNTVKIYCTSIENARKMTETLKEITGNKN
ncbi:hypothetical protein [Tenacibaculum aestuarii]|uniref:hypothetical protein n=1 Tax=Tenacibaculum aestuarii TaxID=362781 RepID=UPI0038950A04